MSKENHPGGSVYLLCFNKGGGVSRGTMPGAARHYIGWTQHVETRVAEHKACGKQSSPLVRAAIERGCVVELARVWPDVTKSFERFLKNQKNAPKLCPLCKPASDGVVLDIEPDPHYEPVAS